VSATDDTGTTEPLLRVERGTPTPEELAALVAVLAARRAAPVEATPTTTRGSRWATYWRTTNQAAQRPGPGAWRSRTTGH
jgi:Acyl-CoA carboxylase epsilon subunit